MFMGGDGEMRGVWESLTMLGALAEATSRVEFGPLVLCTPFRNPGLIAWMANTLEEISGGRFVLGLGAGWHQPEFDAFGFEFDHKVERLRGLARGDRASPARRQGRLRRSMGCRPRGAAASVAAARRPADPHCRLAAADDASHCEVGRPLEQRLVRAADRRVPRRASGAVRGTGGSGPRSEHASRSALACRSRTRERSTRTTVRASGRQSMTSPKPWQPGTKKASTRSSAEWSRRHRTWSR